MWRAARKLSSSAAISSAEGVSSGPIRVAINGRNLRTIRVVPRKVNRNVRRKINRFDRVRINRLDPRKINRFDRIRINRSVPHSVRRNSHRRANLSGKARRYTSRMCRKRVVMGSVAAVVAEVGAVGGAIAIAMG